MTNRQEKKKAYMDDLIRQWLSISCDVLIEPWLTNVVCVFGGLVVDNIDGLKVDKSGNFITG
jgi:hypothetical protein